ncbi:MAG: hypothetical protein JWM36_2458 [Hyphomicrobiales bacterium]|nr:hypothetical protein [Hyphomicrobiales bacterium]
MTWTAASAACGHRPTRTGQRLQSRCARHEEQECHEFRMPGGADATSRPVCPRLTRGMTARISTAMAPAVSAWTAEAAGTPISKMDSPSNAVATATQP